jgi:hypothetical protein
MNVTENSSPSFTRKRANSSFVSPFLKTRQSPLRKVYARTAAIIAVIIAAAVKNLAFLFFKVIT